MSLQASRLPDGHCIRLTVNDKAIIFFYKQNPIYLVLMGVYLISFH